MRMRKLRLRQDGDTIVEVLISIAIISLVLASGYAITNRNLATTQDTQEHGQAQEIVKRQIEELRATSADGTITSFANGDCVVENAGVLSFASGATGACSFQPGGNLGNCTTEPCYKVVINKNALGAYEIQASWDSIIGGNSTVGMDYRI